MKKLVFTIATIVSLAGWANTMRAQEAADGVWQAGEASQTQATSTVNDVTLFRSRPYISLNVKAQNFEDTLELKPRQEQLPLFLTVNNGGNGRPGFKWFRLNIAGYLMASEADMGGATSKAIDVTGKMQPGGGQIIMEAAGEPGATLTWSLETPPIIVDSVRPSAAARGQELILSGRNFSSDESQDNVIVNGAVAKILSAGNNSITIQIPPNAALGKGTVFVSVDSLNSDAVPIYVGTRVAPVLHGTEYWMAPPGATLSISGQNFSPKAADNQVYFGSVAARVISASDNNLTVVVPNWGYGAQQLNIPLYVVTEGTRSANFLRFDIGPKYLGALPPMPGDSYSEASSQASSQAYSAASSQATSQASSQATSQASSQAGTQSYQENPLRVIPGQ